MQDVPVMVARSFITKAKLGVTLLCIATLPPGCKHDGGHHDGAEHSATEGALDPGDLLFQDLDCGPLCDAIEAVTEGVDGRDFSHVGMVVRNGDGLAVCEAIGAGVHLTSLAQFTARSAKVLVGHWPDSLRSLAFRASVEALHLVGTPYDDAFLPGTEKLYCSELVALTFQQANGGAPFFDVPPMTFKDPSTGAFFPAWVEYYAALGQPIPEGVAGCDPGELSRDVRMLYSDADH